MAKEKSDSTITMQGVEPEKKKMVEIDAGKLAVLKAKAANSDVATVTEGSIKKPISQTGVRINPDPRVVVAELGLHPHQEPSVGIWGYFKDNTPEVYIDPKTGKKLKTQKLIEVKTVNVPQKESPMGSSIEPKFTEVSILSNLPDGSWPSTGVNTMGIHQWNNLIKRGLKKVD